MHNYKTFDDQINILQERGLIINDIDQAKEILEIHNYYKIYFVIQMKIKTRNLLKELHSMKFIHCMNLIGNYVL